MSENFEALYDELVEAICGEKMIAPLPMVHFLKQGAQAHYTDGWNAAIEAAAQFMLSRKVSASEFYAAELRKLAR